MYVKRSVHSNKTVNKKLINKFAYFEPPGTTKPSIFNTAYEKVIHPLLMSYNHQVTDNNGGNLCYEILYELLFSVNV